MLYLHVIDTHDIEAPVKSMFVEDMEAYKVGKIISKGEVDNLIIINSIEINRDNLKKRMVRVFHVFLNGNEDINYSETLKIKRNK
jgi:hypothetical protein